MEILIKNKWFSLGGGSIVTNTSGKELAYVKGHVFSFDRRKDIYDENHNLVYIVTNQLFSIFNNVTYIWRSNGRLLTEMDRKLFTICDKYRLYNGSSLIELKGDLFGLEFDIYENSKLIGCVYRNISLRDSFSLNIDSPNYLFYVALVIALDNDRDRRKIGSLNSAK